MLDSYIFHAIESEMQSCDTDPKSWKEAMASYDTAEWAEGIKEEMDSLWAHKVFTLILKSSGPNGHRIMKLRPHCCRKCNKKGEVVQWKVQVGAKGSHNFQALILEKHMHW